MASLFFMTFKALQSFPLRVSLTSLFLLSHVFTFCSHSGLLFLRHVSFLTQTGPLQVLFPQPESSWCNWPFLTLQALAQMSPCLSPHWNANSRRAGQCLSHSLPCHTLASTQHDECLDDWGGAALRHGSGDLGEACG